jgi:integrase
VTNVLPSACQPSCRATECRGITWRLAASTAASQRSAWRASAAFLVATAGHRLHVVWRLVLTRGLRRGEVCGLKWEDIDLDSGHLRIRRALLEFGGRVTVDTPKSRKSARVVSLDAETVRLLREHRRQQATERLAAGSAYELDDWVTADEIGRPYRPDTISRRFRQAARAAGLPVIKLHEGRHTAATLALEAGVDIKVVSAQLGHSTTQITADIYRYTSAGSRPTTRPSWWPRCWRRAGPHEHPGAPCSPGVPRGPHSSRLTTRR